MAADRRSLGSPSLPSPGHARGGCSMSRWQPARLLAGIALGLALATGSAGAQQLKVIGYNVESGGAKPNFVKLRIEEADGVDLWGLSELQNDADAAIFEAAAAVGEQ